MGNITASFTISSPRTICHRAISWAARGLRLRNFQITDNNRALIQTTIVLDRAREPADALRQQLRERIEENPGTLAVSWTSRDEITTALSMSSTRLTCGNTTGHKHFLVLLFSKTPWHTPEERTCFWEKQVAQTIHLGHEITPTEKLKPGSIMSRLHWIQNNHKYSKSQSTKKPLLFSTNAHYYP